MSSSLIIDNWLLQDVGGCLSFGLNDDVSSELVINRNEDTHSIKDVPSAGVQVEALLGLLADIVFRDSLIVDSDFTNTWEPYRELFSPLLTAGLVRDLPFRKHDNQLREPKRFALDQLCVTSTLRDAQQRNEESWRSSKRADNPYMSAVIWGAAGMLSRSHVFESPYSGHPLRKRLIEQVMLSSIKPDVVSEFQEWMMDERLRLFETRAKASTQRAAMVVLPPAVIEIIEESKNVSDLVTVAFQMRDKYRNIREWLRLIQEAVESEDTKQIAKYKKTLDAVSNDIEREVRKSNLGTITLKLGFCMPSISVSLGTIDGVMKNFGIRSTLNNQIFSERGGKTLKKFLRMFDEDNSKIGLSVEEYFITR